MPLFPAESFAVPQSANEPPTGPPAQRVLVVVATYQEMENLPSLVEKVFAAAPGVDLLVVDDDSPDGTGQWVAEAALKDARLRLLSRKGERGFGSAVLAGLRRGVEEGYDFVVNLDADHSHDPVHIPQLLAGMNPPDGPRRDVMIGSRYVAGGGVVGWPLKRKLMSLGVNLLSRWWLWLPPNDCSGAYRCYRTSTLARVDLTRMLSHGYAVLEELLWRLAAAGATFGEIPITFRERVAGASKIRLSEGLKALWVFGRLGPLYLARRPADAPQSPPLPRT